MGLGDCAFGMIPSISSGSFGFICLKCLNTWDEIGYYTHRKIEDHKSKCPKCKGEESASSFRLFDPGISGDD